MSSTAVNPNVVNFGGNRVGLERDTLPIADSQTWKVGEFGILSSGELSVAVTGDIPTHIFRTTRTTAENSTYVEVDRLEVGTQLEMYCSAAVGVANLMVSYDLTVSSNVHTVNLSSTSDAVFKIVDLAATYEPERNATADNPGKCIVEIQKLA
jgi:hypothetical protein